MNNKPMVAVRFLGLLMWGQAWALRKYIETLRTDMPKTLKLRRLNFYSAIVIALEKIKKGIFDYE